MIRYLLTILTIFTFVLPRVSQAEEESPLSVSLSSDIYSDYMFRGFNLYNGLSVQPSVDVTYAHESAGSIGLNVWSHLPADNDIDEGEFVEIDYAVTYSKDIHDVNLSTGYTHYTYPRKDGTENKESGEIFVSLAWDTLLTPTFSFFSDVISYENEYYELSLSHEIEASSLLGDGARIVPYVSFGFSTDSDKVYESDGLTDITYGFELPLKSGQLDVTPSFNMTHGIDDYTTTNFWFGVSLSYSNLAGSSASTAS